MELKNVIRPLRAKLRKADGVTVTLKNHMDFLCADEYAALRYTLTQDESTVEEGTLPLPHIRPHKSAQVQIPVTPPTTGMVYLNLFYTSIADHPLMPAGHELGFDQLILHQARVTPHLDAVSGGSVKLDETATHWIVSGAGFQYRISKTKGLLENMTVNEKELLALPMEYNIWRAPTDNDRNIRHKWQMAGYDRMQIRVAEMKAKKTGKNRYHSSQFRHGGRLPPVDRANRRGVYRPPVRKRRY